MVGAYLLEQFAGISTSVYYAGEFRYAPPPLAPHTLTIGVTQSGGGRHPGCIGDGGRAASGHGDPAFAPVSWG